MTATTRVVVLDTEWGYRNGAVGFESAWVPVVLCALIFPSRQEHVFLPGVGDRRLADFLAENEDALWVAHSITAEMKYLLRLNMSIPAKWYDTLLAERWLTNSPLRPEVALVKALERRGLLGLAPLEKDEIRQKILNLDFSFSNDHEMEEIAEYCLQDCRACAVLFEKQRVNQENRDRLDKVMSWWPHYQLAVAKMELHGVPVDVPAYKKIIDNWPVMREALANGINAIAPIMGISGINRTAFFKFCKAKQIRLPKKYDNRARQMRYSIENEALKGIEHFHPIIPKARETHKTLVAFRSNRMVVDADTGRHYFGVVPRIKSPIRSGNARL